MKILAIRGERLASLHERFEVDFTREPLSTAGIFAITGHTGAGKSTILDAMCLALYGYTPRVTGNSGLKIPLGSGEPEEERLGDKDPRHLLSKGSRHGFAEVEFRGKGGQTYRARWSVVAKPRATTIGDAVMSVVRLDDGQVLADSLKAARDVMPGLVGFTFAEFQKAVLLPQGQFAEFLKASEKERAALLEKVAGGEIYAEVGRLAAERCSREKEALGLLEKEAEGHVTLPEDRLQEERARRARADAALEAARQLEAGARAALGWHEELALRTREVRAAEEAHGRASAAEAAAAPRRLELEAVERAVQRREALTAVTRAEGALTDAGALVGRERGALERAGRELDAARGRIGEAERARDAVEAERQRTRPELEEAKRLDVRAAEARQRAEAARDAAAKAAEAARGAARKAAAQAETCAGLERTRDEAAAWLQAHQAEAPVAADWGRCRDRLLRRRQALAEAAGAKARRDAATTPGAVEAARTAAREAAQAAQAAAGRAEAAALALDAAERALGEAQAHAEQAELAHRRAREAQDLGARRGELEPGAPCPLCGATEHPWAGQAEVDSLVAAAAGVVKAAEAGLKAAKADAEARRKAAAAAAGEARAAEAVALAKDGEAARLAAELERAGRAAAEAELRRAEEEVRACEGALAEPFAGVAGWQEALRADEAAFVRRWEGVERSHRERAAAAAAAEAALAREAPARATLAAVAGQEAKASEEASVRAGEARAEQDALAAARAKLLGGRPAAELEAGLERRQREAAVALEAAVGAAAKAEAAVAGVRGSLRAAEAQLAGAEAASGEATAGLAAALAALGVDRATFEAQLEQGEPFVARARQALQALAAEARDAAIRLSERRLAVASHEERRPPLGRPEAEAALAQAAADAAAADGERLAATSLLDADARARRALLELGPRLEAQRARHAVAAQLNELIGVGKGAAFRAFAQGLALDALLQHANRHLEELAPRYRLARLPGTDLELQILDRDFGDAVRGVPSLSGGETFLVSLGLALGLSGLATRQVQVESLFVDEGFGTLDPETLDQAMAVLERLQATGRTVGVISHVPELHERIGVLVKVEKLGAGRSRVRAVRAEAG